MDETMDQSFRKFLILWLGSFVAAIGNGLTSFGLGVYVFEQTGLASATTLIMLLAFLPGLLLTPLAGILADRYDRRLLMILGDTLSAGGLVFILICMSEGKVQLWQIGTGVAVSSAFSSLIEPAFRATVTDLLSEQEYSKASGLMQVSHSAKFLISPVIAGFLLVMYGIKLLLVIDICTLFLTVTVTFFVRRGLAAKKNPNEAESLGKGFLTGLAALIHNRGVWILTLTGSCISFFLGCVQSLYTPMILSFADSSVLGIAITVSASGMLVTSVFLGLVSIRKGFVRMLCASLFFAGLFMAGFGMRENLTVICFFGFLLFSMLPFANTGLDYLIRTNIDNEVQGRVWGLIGIISQLGYVAAYALLGPLADYVFTHLLLDGGALAGSVGKVIGVGPGRGVGLLIIAAGTCLSLTALMLYRIRAVRALEAEKKDSRRLYSPKRFVRQRPAFP